MARRATATLSVLTLALTVACATGWTAVNRLEGNLTVNTSITSLLSRDRSATQASNATYSPENILVVGSDTRTGQGTGYGSTVDSSGNGQSDTAFILHISADRKSAFAVSIPRDSWVTRPGCKADGTLDGTTVTGKFNSAYAAGGAGCIIAAVKQLTGIPIDHFVEVNFKGFKAIVDALDGVSICATTPISDPIRKDAHGNYEGSGLELPAGTSVLTGDQALAFVRARHIGDGSDLARIDRQHKFISSIIRSASSNGLLSSPMKLYQVLSAITGSLTVDAGLSGDSLKTFLISLEGMSPAAIKFYTVPNTPRNDHENVVWKAADADLMWNAMINDTAYPPKAIGAPAGQPVLTVHTQDVAVTVLNGSGIVGLARKAANQLAALGFTIASVSNAPTSNNTTSTITYDPLWDVSLHTLAWAADNPQTKPVAGHGRTMVLTIGKNWTAARTVKITNAASGTTAADASCAN